MAARPTSCRTKRTQCSHRPNRRKECCDHGAAADRASHERTRAARWANMWPWVPPSRIRTTVSRTHRATPQKGGARYDRRHHALNSRTSQTESQTIQTIHTRHRSRWLPSMRREAKESLMDFSKPSNLRRLRRAYEQFWWRRTGRRAVRRRNENRHGGLGAAFLFLTIDAQGSDIFIADMAARSLGRASQSIPEAAPRRAEGAGLDGKRREPSHQP